ncbi:hypothetical protein BTH160X_50220 [Brochothrix thermosphacta]|nr:hypothetical protein BTH160X_50220 [Brochothrix thermosphacta]
MSHLRILLIKTASNQWKLHTLIEKGVNINVCLKNDNTVYNSQEEVILTGPA